ncbi:hypothetical protein GCM10009682_49470 [Luedemannella flava]|uniref:PKD domain-containing protein n=2 Tax=Luedemannella flava TaxID=349316 RepID=A0ABN2ME73_9ACTN
MTAVAVAAVLAPAPAAAAPKADDTRESVFVDQGARPALAGGTRTTDGKPGEKPRNVPKRPAEERAVKPAEVDRLAKTAARANDQLTYRDSATLDAPASEPTVSLLSEVPDAPNENELDECINAPGAKTQFGRVHNRFLYCREDTAAFDFWEIDTKGVPIELEGTNTFTYTLIAYGSNKSRTIRVFLKVQEDSVEYDEWDIIDRFTVAPDLEGTIILDCADVTDLNCVATNSGITHTFADWDDGSDWLSWDITSREEGAADVADKILRHQWRIRWEAEPTDDFPLAFPGHSVSRTIRCDSATYYRGDPKACVFYDVIPHLTYSTADPAVKGVAEHIRDAQNNPNGTDPRVSPPRDKRIPGKFLDDASAPALHRIANSDPQYNENRDHKDGACYGRGPVRDQYAGLGLWPDNTPTTGNDCDEYPFRSTREGAASRARLGEAGWDFSVRAVDSKQNQLAGSRLNKYYRSDRILYNTDDFYVNIIDGGGPFPEIPGGSIVDAGPDVTGTEGSLIYLAGTSPEPDDATVRWTIDPLSGVDAGTTCTFLDETSPTTYVSCTDDGTFTATLTLDNEVEAPLSDSAIVTVENAPPHLTLRAPQPWQLFRVNTPVTLDAPFTDASSNDTHSCRVVWDDGSAENYGATSSTCDRSHTFTRAGMFTIDVSVTDDDGGSDSRSVMVVVYDPRAGFTNADGSESAPAGSLRSAPGASGEGWFHLTARYYPQSDTVPTGAARTWLTGTDFRFDSTALEWLVVTPDGKTAAKGTGSVGGVSMYGFVFYGYDGCDNGQTVNCRPGPDRFRMVVWDRSTGTYPTDFPLFDTRQGTNYDIDVADPRTLLSGRVTIDR